MAAARTLQKYSPGYAGSLVLTVACCCRWNDGVVVLIGSSSSAVVRFVVVVSARRSSRIVVVVVVVVVVEPCDGANAGACVRVVARYSYLSCGRHPR